MGYSYYPNILTITKAGKIHVITAKCPIDRACISTTGAPCPYLQGGSLDHTQKARILCKCPHQPWKLDPRLMFYEEMIAPWKWPPKPDVSIPSNRGRAEAEVWLHEKHGPFVLYVLHPKQLYILSAKNADFILLNALKDQGDLHRITTIDKELDL